MVINFNVSHVGLEDIRALVVQSLETRAETGLHEIADTPLVAFENGWGMSRRDGFSIDGVAVVVVEDKEVVVAETGRGGETSRLISVDQAGEIGFDHSREAIMCDFIGGVAAGESESCIGVVQARGWSKDRLGLGGP